MAENQPAEGVAAIPIVLLSPIQGALFIRCWPSFLLVIARMRSHPAKPIRNLILVLGDQLTLDSPALADYDAKQDRIWMAEVREESTHVWTHKCRIAIFLTAMRHFKETLTDAGYQVEYRQLALSKRKQDEPPTTLAEALAIDIERLRPQKLLLVQPGEHRVQEDLLRCAAELDIPLEILEDTHFLCTPEEFAAHAKGRKQLRMEFFYREMRKTHKVLMEGDKPLGGEWNFDHDNRGSFGKQGPGKVKPPRKFKPDAITQEVLTLVEKEFPSHPGSLEEFDWPVTPDQARQALRDFITHHLEHFGQYQDAMWTDEPHLYHSRLSAAMNLKLLDPREVIKAAEEAYHKRDLPLASVEGFIRQILGWREYVHGIYWHFMPQYVERNAMRAKEPLPDFYWTGKTEMHCLRQTIEQTLRYGYAHHIQRLMVTGLFSLLLGVDPKEVHQWYLAVYVDAVEWVELPNTLGMSQYADGGVMASKPYVASGKYIERMSNYCKGCRFDPGEAIGSNACPFTTLYWDYLQRHQKTLQKNPRMTMQLKNLDRLSDDRKEEIRQQAKDFRLELIQSPKKS